MWRQEVLEGLRALQDGMCGDISADEVIASLETIMDIAKAKQSKPIVKKDVVENVITLLNTLSGKNFRASSKKTKSLINARLNDGYDEIDLFNVVRIKCKEWVNTPMDKYLRPETIFGGKFEGYLNQKDESYSPQPEEGTIAWSKWFYGELTSEQRAIAVLSKEVTYGLDEYMANEEDMMVFKRIAMEYGNIPNKINLIEKG